jgi:predicted ATPase
MATFLNRLDGHGLFLLDEPEAALSPTRQLAFVVRMHDLSGDFSQFVIATHSPLILAYPDAFIYRFDESGIERVALRDTDHYRMTKRFLDDPEEMMKRLLADEGE